MKVAIYCRLSEEDKNKSHETDDSESIQNQKSMLISYAVNQGWEIYHIYSDDDYTGSDRSRPAFNKLLEEAEARKFNVVLCKSQSRFTREMELVEKYLHTLFPQWGIRFVSIVDNADTDVKGNKKARQINGLINEWYLEDLSENIKGVFRSKQQHGQHIGAFALYGYMKDPNQKGHLIIDEEAGSVVREVFTLFAQGYGKQAIARMLNDRGIPNPTEYKRQKGLRYKQAVTQNSTKWKYFAISDMLINEMYIGNMVQNRYASVSYKTKKNKPVPRENWIIVEGTHEPIIDMELWNSVQSLIKQKAKPFTCGKIGLFARKVKCQYCGYTMRSSKQHGQHYLRCSIRYTAKDACIGSYISVKSLSEAVLGELRKVSEEYLDKTALEKQVHFRSRVQEKIERLAQQRKTYSTKMTECTQAVKSLYDDKVKGLITDDEFVELSREYHSDKERLTPIIKSIDLEMAELEKEAEHAEDKSELVARHLTLEKLEREHVETLIDTIYVGKRAEKSLPAPIEIHWNF